MWEGSYLRTNLIFQDRRHWFCTNQNIDNKRVCLTRFFFARSNDAVKII